MRTAKIITRVAEVAANNRFSPQRRKLGYFAVILQVSEIIKTAKMRNIWNYYSRFIRCALNTETKTK